MSSGAPSPNSSPSADPPASTVSPPPPPVSTSPPPPVSTSPPPLASSPPPTPSTTSPPPAVAQPNANNDSPPPSTPSTPSNSTPPQSPPPTVPAVPPPVALSPPPPQPPSVPPPLPTPSPPILPPPSPPVATPPVVSSSPPPPVVSSSPPPPVVSSSPPPPVVPSSPPPPVLSPPSPPVVDSPPPVSQPPPSSPPPSQAVPPSPPSPVVSPPTPTNNSPPPLPSTSPSPPLPSTSPPPPSAIPTQKSPPPPRRTSPPQASPQVPSPPPPRNTPPRLPPPPTNQPNPTPPSPPLPPSTSPETNTSSGGSPPFPTPPIPGVPTGPTNNSVNPGVPNTANSPSSNNNGMKTGSLVGIGVVVGFVVLSLIGVAVWCLKRQKKKVAGYHGGYVMPSPHSSQMSDSSFLKVNISSPPVRVRGASSSESVYSPPEPGGLNNSRSWFTYEELLEVTNGFSEKNVLGEGGFGCVYKGCLADGREVAVKQLKVGGSQGEREFRAEVETISRIHHRHLVSLVGYCISDDHRLLVYDYVPNNTLYYHLHGEGRTIMNWATRVKVAAGAARGIAYLHEDCHPRIIHRDIKSSNILLDNNFEALVADFGLAKLALDAYTHITTRVMGTFGYMAPEYASSGKLTEKSDVYSYGVVLLELITGRKPVDVSQPLGDESLVEWARPLLNQALENQEYGELVDPTLDNNYVAAEMFRMVEAAAACVRHSAGRRPRMGQVVRALDCSDHSSDLINGMKPGQSEVYDSAQQSAEIRLFQRMAFGSQDYSSEIFSRGSYG